MTNKPNITATSWIMMISLGFIWGGTFLATEIALEGITPFWLAASRIVLGATATVAVWQMQGRKLFAAPADRRQYFLLFVIAGLSSAVPFALLAWGQQYVTAGFAGVSMASTALIVLPLAHFFIPGERVTWLRTLGFVVGFAGVVVLIGLQAFDSSRSQLELWGRLAALGRRAVMQSVQSNYVDSKILIQLDYLRSFYSWLRFIACRWHGLSKARR